jgi:hypothetical protein
MFGVSVAYAIQRRFKKSTKTKLQLLNFTCLLVPLWGMTGIWTTSRMSQPLGVLAVCGAWRAILVRPGVHGRTCLPRQEVPVLQPPEDRFERVFLE